MLNIFDEVVSRVEHSRLSYNSQTEDFHDLNTNLQTYLNEMKRIDDDNRQLQENINQIRANYLLTLENHLKRLPKDFQEQSNILTDAHVERYRSKSRARRCVSEREELKKRIAFLSNNDKDQVKRLNQLQKQDRLVQNELKNLTDQLQNLHNYVQNERQTHRRAMDKVDYLQIQLEQICVERSKTEFEVQTLREEVQLMQTTKEFLDDEYQTILSTQSEANEFFLSCLNQSIPRIRDDFQDLQRTQVKQMENEYKQMNQVLEETSLANVNAEESTITQYRTTQIEYEKLQDEHRSTTQDLRSLNDHNQVLTERILAMENDLYAIRSERMGELIIKDKEFERSQMELRTLNEKLNHLAEYDRNLKFELTLYRGVLESEYRRKQQQLTSNQQLVRPATLKSRSSKTLPTSTNCQHLEPIVEKNNEQTDGIVAAKHQLNDDFDQQESLSRQWRKSAEQNQEEHQILTENLKSPNSVASMNQLSSTEVQLAPSSSPTNDPVLLPADQLSTSNDQQLPESSLTNEEASVTATSSSSTGVPESDSISLQDRHNVVESMEGPVLSEQQLSPASTLTIPEDQLLSVVPIADDESSATEVSQISPEVPESISRLPEDSQTLTESVESQVLSDKQAASEVELSPTSSSETLKAPTSITPAEVQSPSSETSSLPMASSNNSILPTNTSKNEEAPVNDVSFTPPENQQPFSTFPDDRHSPTDTVNSAMRPEIPYEAQKFDSTLVAPEEQEESSTQLGKPQETAFSTAQEEEEVEQLPTISSIKEEVLSETEPCLRSPTNPTSSTETDEHQTKSNLQHSSNTPSADDPSISADIEQKVSVPSEEQPLSVASNNTFAAETSKKETNLENEITESSGVDVDQEENTNTSAYGTHDIEIKIRRRRNDPIQASNLTEHRTVQVVNPDSSSSMNLPTPFQEEIKPPRNYSDDNQSTSEELVRSSDQTNIEEDNSTAYVSSSGYYGTSNGLLYSINHTPKEKSSNDIEGNTTGEVGLSTSPDIKERDSKDNTESDLEASLQDLRFVYRQLINEEELVEINDDFSEKLTDRLEFDDNLILTVFDKFLKKYIIQPANEQMRSNTLDWIEFRDILFPIITGRYTAGHIRRLFDLFDTSRYGYLSIEEISELLELLQMNNTTDLIAELNINQSGKLTFDEFLERIKKIDDGKNNILSEAIEDTSWYNQYPTEADDNDVESISLEVPIAQFPPKINKEIRLLARIFKRTGIDVDSKQLDSHKPTLLMKLTNEFVHNNNPISTDDLQFFIELYLDKKQKSDRFINWIEFRTVFSPFVNDGMLSRDDIACWFHIFDRKHHERIDREQVLHLLRLLQIPSPDTTLSKILEMNTDNKDSWTLEELISTLENLDETKAHLLPNNELTSAFDLDWFTKNVF